MTEMRDPQTVAGELDFVTPDTPIDLTNCEREPIHIPGAIQPPGAGSTFRLTLASADSSA